MGNGNLEKHCYLDTALFSDEQAAKIANGEYPIVLAKDGQFTFSYISESELSTYTHFDALDTAAADLRAQYGNAVPIVYDGLVGTGGIENKVLEAPTEETPA